MRELYRAVMEFLKNGAKVRLKGPHSKYLWADDDHYRAFQHHEAKNARALWRVERGEKTIRLQSCFDTYLTADEHHHHNLSVLGFSGKKVVQMRPEHVESSATFEWEPVIEGSFLRLKTCHGTFLRANSSLPPWCNSVTHDLPRHEKHQKWLLWEVDIVPVPKFIPLEILHESSDDKIRDLVGDLTIYRKRIQNQRQLSRLRPEFNALPHT